LILNNLNGRLLIMTIVLAAVIIFLIFHILLKNKSNTKQII
jgi:hypothetical protein